MTSITALPQHVCPQRSGHSLLLVAIFLGLATFAAVLSSARQEECKPFTIGVSDVASCDYIGWGLLTPPATLP